MDLSDLCTWTHARRVSLGVQLLVSLPFNWFLGPPTGNPDSPEPAMTMHVGPKNQCHRIMNNDRWWNVAVLGCVSGLQKKNQICICAVDLLGLSPARKSLQVAFFLRRVFFLILFVSFPGWIGWDSAGWADRTLWALLWDWRWVQPHVAKSMDWRFGSMFWFVRSLCRAAFQANCAPSSKWSLSPPPLLAAFLFYLFTNI